MTTWWTKRAEREEGWRERLIAAADDFLQRLLDANKAYEVTIHTIRAGPQANARFEDIVRDQWGTAVDITNEARHSNARVVLLFGMHSEVVRASTFAINATDAIDATMKKGRLGEAARDQWFDALDLKVKTAGTRALIFSDVASRAIWTRPRRPPGESFEAASQRLGDQVDAHAEAEPKRS